jgi:Ca2+-binding EF-hand superfamily protein
MPAAAATARFKERDKNGDGRLTPDEFPEEARFKAMDEDGDGAVTLEEMKAAVGGGKGPGAPGKGGLRGDKNGDGKVTREEFKGSDEAFRGLDKNADGAITPDELPKDRPGKGGPPPGGQEPADGMPPPAGPMGGLFAALDKDGDGRLARNEFPGGDDKWRALDENGDGWVTPDEAR